MKYSSESTPLTADVCVIGGGMSGVCAAIAAARHGAKVVLMQDRPVLAARRTRTTGKPASCQRSSSQTSGAIRP